MTAINDDGPNQSTADLIDSDTRARVVLEPGTLLANRYRIVRLLGRGAMGSVYEALDEARSSLRVALKLLGVHQAGALYRLKNEFRALSETLHPNLVGLHGLGVDERGWFVVMDLIDESADFQSYVRSGQDDALDLERLRSGLIQLLHGVGAIHSAGKVHRDLKPSNVLVSREGRVLIADFGLVGDQVVGGVGHTFDGWFAGTPAYAAPEQLAGGGAIGHKSDLYAIGVLLFQALTGKLPFGAGTAANMLERKLRELAPDPRTLAPSAPEDLSRLCLELLERDPARRPDLAQLLARLDETQLGRTAIAAPPFVAREGELARLRAASAQARASAPVIALVSGPSGIGKSTLLARFFELMRREPGSVLLEGRCHALEQVPYNAFDTLIDALGRHLMQLPLVDAASLMPRDVGLLARLFPTLNRVPAVLQMPEARDREIDEALLRARAFLALKELLARIADRGPLICCFDDLQWSDDDSTELLRELLRPPGAASCLFVCAFRTSEAEAENPALGVLRNTTSAPHIALQLGPLERPAASELARAMLGAAATDADLELVVAEAAGSPFLIRELALVAEGRSSVLDLQATVARRVDRLEPDARSLLELVCISGTPLELSLCIRAAGVGAQALPSVLASALVRTNVLHGRECLESAHDRIREAISSRIAPERAAVLHATLARELCAEPDPDPELIAHHYRAAGMVAAAAPFVLRAAERATHALAFGRAVELYASAIAEAGAATDTAALELALADTYANAGRLGEAAERYERLLGRSQHEPERRALSAKAMLLHFLSGEAQRGARFVDQLCQQLGIMPLPRRRLFANLVQLFFFLRYVLGRRITSLPLPEKASRAPLALQRMDLFFRASRGFASSSPDHSVYFGLRAMVATRAYRDAKHWPLAMAGEVTFRCMFRGVSGPRDEHDLARAIHLAEVGGDAEMLALVLTAGGIVGIYTCRHPGAVAAFERAEAVLTERGRSAIQLFNTTRAGRLAVWTATGRFDEVVRHRDAWLEEARALGDRFGELGVRLLAAHGDLALDQPAAAHESLAMLDVPAEQETPLVADAWWRGDVALYEGDARAALAEDARARGSRYFRTMQRIPEHRVWSALFLGRACLLAAPNGQRTERLHVAARAARELERERFALGPAAAAQLRAGLNMLAGDAEAALTELHIALARYEACHAALHAAAVRFRIGQLQGGDLGKLERETALGAARKLGARNPERWFASLVTGF